MKKVVNKFGRIIELGQKVTLNKDFSNYSQDVFVSEITDNGLYFKVSGFDGIFSVNNLKLKGSKYSFYISFN